MDTRPIGVFDSGVGGLTVAKEIMTLLPEEKVVYFGDTARVPYGSKSQSTIKKYAQQIIRFLLTQDVKAIVVACNTVASLAVEEIKEMVEIPVLDVVRSGVIDCTVNTTQNKTIGVIGTEGTIGSQIYSRYIIEKMATAKVIEKACPLFVPLVEEGWIEENVTYEIAKKYLKGLIEEKVDTIILGCTHYPLIKDTLQQIVGDGVYLVNPALETAKELKRLIDGRELSRNTSAGHHAFYVSDRAEKFQAFAKRILNHSMLPVQLIAIEDY